METRREFPKRFRNEIFLLFDVFELKLSVYLKLCWFQEHLLQVICRLSNKSFGDIDSGCSSQDKEVEIGVNCETYFPPIELAFKS